MFQLFPSIKRKWEWRWQFKQEQIRGHKKALKGGFKLICAFMTGREDITLPSHQLERAVWHQLKLFNEKVQVCMSYLNKS